MVETRTDVLRFLTAAKINSFFTNYSFSIHDGLTVLGPRLDDADEPQR